MALAKKKCKVCGKSYDACKNAKKLSGAFSWRDVACSYKCGTIYFDQIAESRSGKMVTETQADISHSIPDETVSELPEVFEHALIEHVEHSQDEDAEDIDGVGRYEKRSRRSKVS